jgi:hypothetical protein
MLHDTPLDRRCFPLSHKSDGREGFEQPLIAGCFPRGGHHTSIVIYYYTFSSISCHKLEESISPRGKRLPVRSTPLIFDHLLLKVLSAVFSARFFWVTIFETGPPQGGVAPHNAEYAMWGARSLTGESSPHPRRPPIPLSYWLSRA